MVWALAVVGAVFAIAAIHPFLTYPLSLFLIRRLGPGARRAPGAAVPNESFAVCFCAYNEEAVIDEKMRNLLALRGLHPTLEILAYVDAATDRTAERLAAYGDAIKLHVSRERLGKTHGMNLLVKMAKAEIVVFTDANVMLDIDALDHLGRHFADPSVGCVCGHLIYVNAGVSATAATGSLYWRLEEWIKALETETGSAMGADGSLFAIRRKLHHPPPDHVCDDMFVSFMILCDGWRVLRADNVKAYEESVSASQEEFRRKVRISCQAFTVHRLLWPRVRRLDVLSLYKYVSHKLLRWLSIFLLALSLASFEGAFALAGHGLVGLGLGLCGVLALAVGWRYELAPFAQLWQIFTALVATGLGVWRSLRGESFQTWTPASSIRK
jgi:cellulose synthase/poly-beta-1,6-N-acetylglucosamine synthase-like glycosyltransferase